MYHLVRNSTGAGTRAGQEHVPQGSSPLNLPGSVISKFSPAWTLTKLGCLCQWWLGLHHGLRRRPAPHPGCLPPPRAAPVVIATEDAILLPASACLCCCAAGPSLWHGGQAGREPASTSAAAAPPRSAPTALQPPPSGASNCGGERPPPDEAPLWGVWSPGGRMGREGQPTPGAHGVSGARHPGAWAGGRGRCLLGRSAPAAGKEGKGKEGKELRHAARPVHRAGGAAAPAAAAALCLALLLPGPPLRPHDGAGGGAGAGSRCPPAPQHAPGRLRAAGAAGAAQAAVALRGRGLHLRAGGAAEQPGGAGAARRRGAAGGRLPGPLHGQPARLRLGLAGLRQARLRHGLPQLQHQGRVPAALLPEQRGHRAAGGPRWESTGPGR